MHLKLALKTLVSAALLFGATAAFAEDPMDAPLPGDVQVAQPVKSHATARRRAAPAPTVVNNQASSVQTPSKAHTKPHAKVRSHKHVSKGSHHVARHGKATKPVAHATRHSSKKAVHSNKPRQAVRHAGKKTDGTAVKSGTHGKTNLKTEKLAPSKTSKPAHGKQSSAKHAPKPVVHGKTAGKSVKADKPAAKTKAKKPTVDVKTAGKSVKAGNPVAHAKAKKASTQPIRKSVAGKNIKQHKAVAKPVGKVVKK